MENQEGCGVKSIAEKWGRVSVFALWLVLCIVEGKKSLQMKKFFAYFIPILLAYAVGALGSYIQGEALVEWYPTLVKSPFSPPSIVFPIAWSVLYLLIGISAGTMLAKGDLSVLRLWLFRIPFFSIIPSSSSRSQFS